MPELMLYYTDSCPYCQKVLAFMDTNDMVIPMRDVGKNRDFKDDLRKIGGKTQVPCLIIDGQAMYESDVIIEWLNDNWQES